MNTPTRFQRHRYENALTVLAGVISVLAFALVLFLLADGDSLLESIGLSAKERSELMDQFSLLLLLPLLPLGLRFLRGMLEGEIQSSGLQVDEDQFPELFERMQTYAQRLGLPKVPELYISINEPAELWWTKFAPQPRCILLSADMAAFSGQEAQLRDFHLARELAQLRLGYHRIWRASINAIPLLLVLPGCALSRAQVYSADALAAQLLPEAACDYILCQAFGEALYSGINQESCRTRWQARSGFSMDQASEEAPLLYERYLAVDRFLRAKAAPVVDGRLM